jgi:predicted PurR-regulated permease PerM
MGQMNWQRTRDILISIICLGIIFWASWNIAGRFVDAIVILLLSLTVAFLLTPAVNALCRLKIPRLIATLIVFVVVVAILAAFGYAIVFSLIQQITNFKDTFVSFFTYLPTAVPDAVNSLQKSFPQIDFNAALTQIRNQAINFAQTAATNAFSLVFIITGTFLNIFLILVLSFYFTLDGKRLRDSIISVVPQRSMPHVHVFEDALNRVVGNYIRGQLTLAVIVGVLSAVVCVIMKGGLQDYALIVGVLAFLFETIPMVGPALASIPALLISLLLPDPFPRTLWVAVGFVIIQMLESNVLGPRIVGRAVGLHPVVSITSLLVFANLFGPFGALIATPIVAAIWVVIASTYRSAHGETPEQMIARKRAPWNIPRPTMNIALRGRRRTMSLPGSPGGGSSSGETPQAETSDHRENATPRFVPLPGGARWRRPSHEPYVHDEESGEEHSITPEQASEERESNV